MPDLVLVAEALVCSEGCGWDDFAAGCELSGVRCVLFSSSDAEPAQVPEWCEHHLPDTSSPALVREYLKVLIRLDESVRKIKISQGQLLACKFEQEEGLRSAAHIQQSLMPDIFPELQGINFAHCFHPCQNVGGDIFNVLRLDEDTLCVYMLDVSGHGVPAAMVTVAIYQALSPHTGQIIKQPCDTPPYYRLTAPDEVLTQLDHEYPFERFDAFFTISYLLINPHTGQIRYANGAHPPPLIQRMDGGFETLEAEGTLVGLGGLVPFEEEYASLRPGDRLFLFTDGLFEHENNFGEQFGHARIRRSLKAQRNRSLKQQCNSLINAANRFGSGADFKDDITLLALEFTPPT
jgi:sigma-B regulation protein RsbU (phosphoserine phosphatase)